MSPQRERGEISTNITAIISEFATELSPHEQDILARRFIAIIRNFKENPHNESMVNALTAAIMPLRMGLNYKAVLLNKVLETTRNFFQFKSSPWRKTWTDL